MKNLLIGIVAILAVLFGCDDKDSTPCVSHNRVDLIGYWVSCDSSITRRGDDYVYAREYLEIRESDTMFIHKINYPYIEFIWKFTQCDTLGFTYTGRPVEVEPPRGYGKHKVNFINGVDTIVVVNLNRSFPTTLFNKFYKIK
jgi:hypothetical protein